MKDLEIFFFLLNNLTAVPILDPSIQFLLQIATITVTKTYCISTFFIIPPFTKFIRSSCLEDILSMFWQCTTTRINFPWKFGLRFHIKVCIFACNYHCWHHSWLQFENLIYSMGAIINPSWWCSVTRFDYNGA